MSFEPQEVAEWRCSLQDYSRAKRDPNPELYRNPNYAQPRTHLDVKQKEYAFDPILNRFRTKEQDKSYLAKATEAPKLNKKSNAHCPYDIITLDKAPPEDLPRAKGYSVENHAQPFNIITNQVQIPNHKAFRMRMKKINEEVFRDYNIINNQYWKNNAEKAQKDTEKVQVELQKKYADTHDFDPIRCNYYESDKEKQFRAAEEQRARALSELKNNRLPKSYKFREPINLNHEKNSFLTEGFEAFKCKEKAKLKRYQKRYEMDQHFRNLGLELDSRADGMKMNKFYARRFLEEYKEGVDPITLMPSDQIAGTLRYALGNKREFVTEKPRPKRKFRFVY